MGRMNVIHLNHLHLRFNTSGRLEITTATILTRWAMVEADTTNENTLWFGGKTLQVSNSILLAPGASYLLDPPEGYSMDIAQMQFRVSSTGVAVANHVRVHYMASEP